MHRRRHRWARACQNKISPANMGQPHKLAIADWMIVNLSGICHVSRYGCHILCPCQRKPPGPSTTSYATRSPGFNRCCRRRRRGHSSTVKGETELVECEDSFRLCCRHSPKPISRRPYSSSLEAIHWLPQPSSHLRMSSVSACFSFFLNIIFLQLPFNYLCVPFLSRLLFRPPPCSPLPSVHPRVAGTYVLLLLNTGEGLVRSPLLPRPEWHPKKGELVY